MALGKASWSQARKDLTALLAGGSAVAQWVPDFASVQELALTTLIMFVEWLAQFSNARTAQMSQAQSPGGISPKSSVASVDVSSRDFVEIVNQVLSVALNSLKPSFPAEHAARLFRSVIVTVRPVGLVSFPAIADTVNRASELCCDLSLETQGAFLGAATNAILQSIAEAGGAPSRLSRPASNAALSACTRAHNAAHVRRRRAEEKKRGCAAHGGVAGRARAAAVRGAADWRLTPRASLPTSACCPAPRSRS